jgi:hypothetical protein
MANHRRARRRPRPPSVIKSTNPEASWLGRRRESLREQSYLSERGRAKCHFQSTGWQIARSASSLERNEVGGTHRPAKPRPSRPPWAIMAEPPTRKPKRMFRAWGNENALLNQLVGRSRDSAGALAGVVTPPQGSAEPKPVRTAEGPT